MAAIRLAARRLGAGTLRRPQMGRVFSPAVEEEQRRLAPPPPTFSFLLFSSSATGHPFSDGTGHRRSVQDLEDRITNIEEKKEELFHMLAQLDIDYPSNSKYARDSRKLLYMLVEQLRDTEIHDPLWPMYERRKVLYDRLKIGVPALCIMCVAGYLKFLS